MAKAIEAGLPKLRIEEAAARTQARIDAGQQSVIGVNKYPPDGRSADRRPQGRQRARCGNCRSTSSRGSSASAIRRRSQDALAALTRAAAGGNGNLLALAIDAARAKATVGEISLALEQVFGRHRAEIKAISGVYKREVGMSDARRARAEAGRRVRGERRPPAAHPGRQDRPGRPRPRAEGDRLRLRRSRLRRRHRPAVRDAGRSRAPGGRERRAHPRHLLARRRAPHAGAGAQGRARASRAAATS